VSFGYFPENIPAAKKLGDADAATHRMQSEEGIEFRLRFASGQAADGKESVLLVVLNENEAGTTPEWTKKVADDKQTIVFCEPRGIGATRWTKKNPPNYVERCHVLLGRTVDAGRVWDVIAAAKYLSAKAQSGNGSTKLPVFVAGGGAAGVIGAYAAVLDDDIAGVTVVSPSVSHMTSGAPQFLNVLRVCDVPFTLGMIAPRPLAILDAASESFAATTAAYAAASAAKSLSIK
jgi:hypothetical protein